MSQTGASVSIVEFAATHHKVPALIVSGTRCGKPNCRCATTQHRHRTACLYWRDASGQPHRRYVPKAEVEAVRAIIERRRAERQAWRTMLAESREQLRFIRWYVRQLQDAGKEQGLW